MYLNIYLFKYLWAFEWERIIVPLLRHLGKLNFTYLGKLRLLDYIVYSCAKVDEGAGVDEPSTPTIEKGVTSAPSSTPARGCQSRWGCRIAIGCQSRQGCPSRRGLTCLLRHPRSRKESAGEEVQLNAPNLNDGQFAVSNGTQEICDINAPSVNFSASLFYSQEQR